MKKKSFVDNIRGFVGNLSDFLVLREKRSLKERRTQFTGLPRGVHENRRRGDDRRLVCSDPKITFYYPF